ncbi:MAG: hypothetical protein Q7K57_44925 [Burkholderiaceae bacterium]|nr:hypothetical protein [Burkholderiaceae bacterium]
MEVYEACIGGVEEIGLTARLTVETPQVQISATEYVARAHARTLHHFPSADWAHDEQPILGSLTKGELISLYKVQMFKRTQPGRQYYDRLLNSAPHSKCPMCGFGHVSTLDHHLPKARYPLFSVLPANLVPSCTDCNKGKGAQVLNGLNDISHPYFEDSRIETDSWLHASVNETSPATAAFSVVAPAHWPADLSRRVVNYFVDLKLPRRFSIEAGSELISLSGYLEQLETSPQIRTYLQKIAQVERNIGRNSWKAALYAALSESAWYLDGGYL